jgi:hypothetical protein
VIYRRDPEDTAPTLLVSNRQARRFAPASKRGDDRDLSSVYDTRGLAAPPEPVKHSEAAMCKAIEALAALVDPLPLHKESRQPVTLEADAARDLRLFWERIGWSKLLRRVCAPPDHKLGEEEARGLLARWMQDAPIRDRFDLPPGGDPMSLPVFPARWRLFKQSRPRKEHDYLIASSYLVVADESERADDPPLFELRPGRPEPLYLPKRYVAHLARQLFDEAFEHSAGAAARPDKNATKAFEPLMDDVWQVAPGVLCRRSLAAGKRGTGFGACFGSLRAYYEYAKSLPDSVLGQGAPRGGDAVVEKLLAKASMTPDKAAKRGFRVSPVFTEYPGRSVQIALGVVEGAPAWLEWLTSHGDRVFGRYLVTTAPDAERVKRALGISSRAK